ncbi:hypothetical protein RPMA_23815 [Tardiphaga alba]|uniref:Uncharacterized protein n=1 Tax=Tardiphaga alba TaxID=340268 RepID=A0ABX8AGU7_9BRAD|nr:hypothetical protein RPMA_23815 [Tardiphaga alba]
MHGACSDISGRHCEERSDEAIQRPQAKTGLLRCARNDDGKERSLTLRCPCGCPARPALWCRARDSRHRRDALRR